MATASFIKDDRVTRGEWHGIYGAGGYYLCRGNRPPYSMLPSYVASSPLLQSIQFPAIPIIKESLQHEQATPDPSGRALRQPLPETGCIAAGWFDNIGFTLDLTVTGVTPQRIALYSIAWDGPARECTMRVNALDRASGVVLHSKEVGTFAPGGDFSQGMYLVYDIFGDVRFHYDKVNVHKGPSLSGIFFDSNGGTPMVQQSVTGTLTIIIDSINPLVVNWISSLPNGPQGQPYGPYTLGTVSGGTPPYTWSVVSGLPPGLNLSSAGVLSGTPSSGGTFNLTVKVTDAGTP